MAVSVLGGLWVPLLVELVAGGGGSAVTFGRSFGVRCGVLGGGGFALNSRMVLTVTAVCCRG